MGYRRAISNDIYVQHNFGMICKKRAIEINIYSTERPKKIDIKPGDYYFRNLQQIYKETDKLLLHYT